VVDIREKTSLLPGSCAHPGHLPVNGVSPLTSAPATGKGLLMADYMEATAEAAAVAVQMWRHTLMHTANPRPLIDTQSGKAYQWLLHWGAAHLSKDHHLHFQPGAQVLNVGLSYLLDDVTAACNKVFAEALTSTERKSIIVDAHRAVNDQRFKV
jgi:hypothetical protein